MNPPPSSSSIFLFAIFSDGEFNEPPITSFSVKYEMSCLTLLYMSFFYFSIDPPPPPRSVRTENITARSATLGWVPYSPGPGEGNIIFYDVIFYHLVMNTSYRLTLNASDASDGHILSHLEPYTNYSWKIRGNSVVGRGAWSELVFFTTDSAGRIPLILIVSAIYPGFQSTLNKEFKVET